MCSNISHGTKTIAIAVVVVDVFVVVVACASAASAADVVNIIAVAILCREEAPLLFATRHPLHPTMASKMPEHR